ncbi:universal stress protein [Thiovibrio frasassiensis]|jgi:nucleotide-binding universal stress UspA family protein|uniref:Universal stress protein n=1 Tax=Thiovibrio frasassiensis TaxID=2984131 RepID=A0A9X4MEC0_9BACT|nr:universal stress protein [Thiovibrio frasassiensis]MDG4474723.1 universal stress protein [Thiovibrio frasassiensis]
MKVIAAMNGLVTSDIAALYALRYAALFNYTLGLLHVLNPDDSRDEVEASMTTIEEAAEEFQVKTERIFLQGEPAPAIQTHLKETNGDILFCSTRMRTRFFEDSLSEKLTRLHLPADLAIVRVAHVGATTRTENILLPIKEDRLSVKKFVFLSAMAKGFDAATEIYSITLAGNRRLARLDIGTTKELFQKINAHLSHYNKAFKLMDVPLRIKHALAENEIDQILHHLAHHDFQLMIIGGRRLSPFPLLFRENPIARLFRYTPVNTIAFYGRDEK